MATTMQVGKYELLSKLATGGMAEVYLARAAGPMGFEKTLVLKRILPQLASDPAFIEMFLAEARLAAQLNHPHIVQIFDFGEAKGEYFLAMEYIDGPNLRVLRKRARARGTPLAPTLCARIIASACEGLAFAHDFQNPATGKPFGLIHRDISPDNILVSRQGAVKVVDFGIAKAAGQGHKTQTGIIKGKVAYMPPEQIRAEELDRRVDVYALGVVLYELLTGRRPFDGTSDASLMEAVLFDPVVPATKLRPELPERVQQILDRAMERDRERRYPDCRAFEADLEDFIVSSGKAVGAYQLSQLVTQLVPPADMLPSSDRASRESGRATTEPNPAPAPSPDAPSSEALTVANVSAKPRRVAGPSVPIPDSELDNLETEPFVAEVAPPSFGSETGYIRSLRRRTMLPALAVAAVLIAGAGYLVGMRTGQSEPPPVVFASLPAAAPPSAPPSPKPVPSSPTAPGAVSSSAPSEPEDHRPTARPSHTATARRNRAEPDSSKVGMLHLNIRGWAEIFIDGQPKGRVPPINELELPPGRHALKLVNPALPPYLATIIIAAGETLEHQVSFSQPAATTSTH